MPQLDTYMYLSQVFLYRLAINKYFSFTFCLFVSISIMDFQVGCADEPWEHETDMDFFNKFIVKEEEKYTNSTQAIVNSTQAIDYAKSENVLFKTAKVERSGVGNRSEIANLFNLPENREFLQKTQFPSGGVVIDETLHDGSDLLVIPVDCLDKTINSRLPHASLVYIKNIVMNQVGSRHQEPQCWFSLKYNHVPNLSTDESNKILNDLSEDYQTKNLLGSDDVNIIKGLHLKLSQIK